MAIAEKHRRRTERHLKQLLPGVAVLARRVLDDMEKSGHPMVIVQSYRSIATQNRLYAMGRTRPGKRVTNARGGYSWHNYRVAVDCAFIAGRTVTWEGPWDLYGRSGQKHGFIWGGTFRSRPDSPHLEFHPGVTLRDARMNTHRWRFFIQVFSEAENIEDGRHEPTMQHVKVVRLPGTEVITEGVVVNGRVYVPIVDLEETGVVEHYNIVTKHVPTQGKVYLKPREEPEDA